MAKNDNRQFFGLNVLYVDMKFVQVKKTKKILQIKWKLKNIVQNAVKQQYLKKQNLENSKEKTL